MRISMLLIIAIVASGVARADDAAIDTSVSNAAPNQAKTMSGMSVLGNNEAPRSLVIVPWKSSQIGDGIGVVDSLSNRPMPVDRDVFARELRYYDLRTDSPTDGGEGESSDLKVGSR